MRSGRSRYRWIRVQGVRMVVVTLRFGCGRHVVLGGQLICNELRLVCLGWDERVEIRLQYCSRIETLIVHALYQCTAYFQAFYLCQKVLNGYQNGRQSSPSPPVMLSHVCKSNPEFVLYFISTMPMTLRTTLHPTFSAMQRR